MEGVEKTVKAFATLGDEMKSFVDGMLQANIAGEYDRAVQKAGQLNPWFEKEHVLAAIWNIGKELDQEKLDAWLNRYRSRIDGARDPRTVGVVMAGNVPLVGFHDFISVLVSGNRFVGKLSSDDRVLLPMLAGRLVEFLPGLGESIRFEEEKLTRFDAVIATGSNNSSRYFEYYFGKYPHIIRKNRNGVAILTGHENTGDLRDLADDVFLFFGMGCRNVSKLFVPEGYDFSPLLESLRSWERVAGMNKYRNNFDYYRSIYMINRIQCHDNGSVMITKDERIASPPSVLYYEEYKNLDEVSSLLEDRREEVQCVVAPDGVIEGSLPFGTAQHPELWDYADGVDTMEFLLSFQD